MFLKNHIQTVADKIFPDPFQKHQNWIFLKISSLICYIDLFICQVEDYRNILKLSCRPIAFTSYKAFLKNKESSGTTLPSSFSA